MKKTKGGTHAGFHFLFESPNCWRKFYLSKVLNLESEQPPYYFPLGSSIHEAFEGYYKDNFDVDRLLSSFEPIMEEHRTEFEPAKYLDYLDSGQQMINCWAGRWHSIDQQKYEILEVEREYDCKLPNGYLFTIKIDQLLKDKSTGFEYIFDKKHTMSSVDRTYATARNDDQASAYIWGLKQHDYNPQGFVLDVMYHKGRVTEARRFDPIYRTEQDIRIFLAAAMNKVEYISHAVERIEAGGDPWFYFPRHGGYACQWSCEFIDLCRVNIRPDDIPVGFKRKEND